MTADELRAAYPGAAEAVCWYEAPENRDYERFWVRARESGRSPAQIVEALRRSADGTTKKHPGWPLEVYGWQMGHPDFARYVAAKLGCV